MDFKKWSGKYAEKYTQIFPNNEIVLFSKKLQDPALDFLKPNRIVLDRELLEDKITVEELENTCVIFDDIDTIRDKEIRKEIFSLMDDILCSGRSLNIFCIISNHLMTNYKETRIILNECENIVIFPRSAGSHLLKYSLIKYYGLSKDIINKIMNLDSRWVLIRKNYPQCVIYENGGFLI